MSGAGISLSTLLRNLPPSVEKFFLVPSASEIDAELGAVPERTFHERYLCQFMTTLYTAQYPPWLFAWHLAKIAVALHRIRQLVRRWKIEVVHVNETSLIAYAFAARLAGVPTVMHARTAIAPRPFERALLSRFGKMQRARIACIDSEVLKSLPDSARRRGQIIFDPVELGPTPSEAAVRDVRASWTCEADTVVIGQVASLHTQKGIWLILDLAEKLREELPNARFVLIGDDSAAAGEGPRLLEAIRTRNLTTSVILPGYDCRLSLVYAAIDIGLCLFGEHLGGVGRGAHEAALAGKPLVATLPIPTETDTLEDGARDYAFAPHDHTGIQNAITTLVMHPVLRKAIGERARISIGLRHDAARIASQTMELYNALTDSRFQ